MNWIMALPLILDVLKEATHLIGTIQDKAQKDDKKEELRAVLKDYAVHQDVAALRSEISRVGNGGAKR